MLWKRGGTYWTNHLSSQGQNGLTSPNQTKSRRVPTVGPVGRSSPCQSQSGEEGKHLSHQWRTKYFQDKWAFRLQWGEQILILPFPFKEKWNAHIQLASAAKNHHTKCLLSDCGLEAVMSLQAYVKVAGYLDEVFEIRLDMRDTAEDRGVWWDVMQSLYEKNKFTLGVPAYPKWLIMSLPEDV